MTGLEFPLAPTRPRRPRRAPLTSGALSLDCCWEVGQRRCVSFSVCPCPRVSKGVLRLVSKGALRLVSKAIHDEVESAQVDSISGSGGRLSPTLQRTRTRHNLCRLAGWRA
jgi:hypothetical protein